MALNRRCTVLVAFGISVGLYGPAQATTVFPDFGSVVQGSAEGDSCPNGNTCFLNLSQTAAATGSANGSNSSASATANLGLGTVSATVSATTDTNPNGTQSHAVIWDTVTFSGAKAGDVATLTISGIATVSAPLAGTGDTARANAAAILIDKNLVPYGVNYFLLGNASTPENGAYTLADQTQINNGDPYLLLVFVDAYAGLSGGPFPGGSATISDPFQLDVPLGVTATFASDVPEPSTWAMMILGFLGLGLMAYRKRDARLAAA